jgi:hypothetical protein
MRWAGHVARMVYRGDAHGVLLERPERRPLGRPRCRGNYIKMDLQEAGLGGKEPPAPSEWKAGLGPISVLDALEKSKVSCARCESNRSSSVMQPLAWSLYQLHFLLPVSRSKEERNSWKRGILARIVDLTSRNIFTCM